MTPKQAATMLGCQPGLIYRLCSERRLRHRRVGFGRGLIQIDPAWVREYQERCEVAPPAESPAETPPEPRVVKGLPIPRYVPLRDRKRDRLRAASAAPPPPGGLDARPDESTPVKSS